MSALTGKTIVLGVTGGISAYKGAELCRLLKKAGADVRVVMTRAACEFITPLTLQTLSGHSVGLQLFDPTEESQIGHIRLADDADAVVVAPATADSIARFAAGMADDLLAAVLLATRAPVLLAPAMNVNMWENPLTRANLARLVGTGRVTTVGPDAGELACGWIGAGRLVEPTEIVAALEKLLASAASLAGRRVVVTAGPTLEAIDDVRFLGNRSSGKMGFALAAAAARRGAEVTLIAGPVSLATPAGVGRRLDVESARDMQQALGAAVTDADVVVMAAAVADFRPTMRAVGKLSRRANAPATVPLTANPDLLAELGRARAGTRPLLVGFAAEVGTSGETLVEKARQKLGEKRCDVVVANDVSQAGLGFGSDRNAVTLVFSDGGVVPLPAASKDALADDIWGHLAPLVETDTRPNSPPPPRQPRAT
jgi:phosphopantothenoylcysteine decarboxylase/phosphopantothenate--cysteine ligase